jgi:hypothetical protein
VRNGIRANPILSTPQLARVSTNQPRITAGYDDAVGLLDEVEVGKYHDNVDTYR